MTFAELIFPFVIIAFIITVTIGIYLRGGRNQVLEALVERGQVGSLLIFRGTLVVAEHRPRFFLKLRKDADAVRLQFQYRWITGVGPQAIFDEVTFDASKLSLELKRKDKITTALFSEFSAVRMRENSGKQGSLWHLELIRLQSAPLLLLSSDREERQAGFERLGGVANAVSTIMSIPVQVVVDGKAWTPGWPPSRHDSALPGIATSSLPTHVRIPHGKISPINEDGAPGSRPLFGR
jgi:hypothetical protein